MAFKWPEKITTEDTPDKLIAQNLPMKEIYSLKFDAYLRQVGGSGSRTLFYGTDGGTQTPNRCGGRLPMIKVQSGSSGSKFRIDFKQDTLLVYRVSMMGPLTHGNNEFVTLELNFIAFRI